MVVYIIALFVVIAVVAAFVLFEPLTDWLLANKSALVIIGIIAGVIFFFKKEVKFLFKKEEK